MSVSSIRRETSPQHPEPDEKIVNAERIVLGGMMSGGSEIVMLVAGRLDTDHFYRPAHRAIFDAVCSLWACDGLTDQHAVYFELHRRSKEEGTHPAFGVTTHYLDECVEAVPTLANVGWFSNKVAAAGRSRRTAEMLRTSAGRLDSGADLDEEMAKVRVALDAIEKGPAAGTWPDPVPLAAQLPEFPVSILPGTLGRIVEAVARSTQTPSDLAAFTALATLSAATRGRWVVTVDPEWIEQTALYLAALSDSGTRKSAVVREVGRPLLDAQKATRDAGRAAYLEEAAAYRILEKQALAAENAAAKPNATADDTAHARGLAREFGEAVRPAQFRFLVDDITPEKLAVLMDEQGGPAAVLSAEGGLLGTLAGRYSDAVNVDLVLKAFNGEYFQADRISRDPVEIEHPFLALGLIVQPDVIAEAVRVPEFVSRGLLPRMLFALPRTTVGTRQLAAPAIPAGDATAWRTSVEALFSRALAGKGSQSDLRLTGDARRALDAFRDELEPRMHPDLGDLAPVMAWASKLPGALVRIAALFALASDPDAQMVSAENVSAAVGLAPYLISHACAALALDRQQRDARHVAVLAWLRRRTSPQHPEPAANQGSGCCGDAFSAREAWQALRGRAWAQTAADVQAVLDELTEMGWIRRRPDPPRKGGRPPSPTYDIHPKFIHGSAA